MLYKWDLAPGDIPTPPLVKTISPWSTEGMRHNRSGTL